MGLDELKKVFAALTQAGVVLKDVLGKKYLAIFGDFITFGALLKSGIDLKAASQAALNLSPSDEADLKNYLGQLLPELDDAALQQKLQDGAALLMQAGDLAHSLVGFEQQVAAYIKNEVEGS